MRPRNKNQLKRYIIAGVAVVVVLAGVMIAYAVWPEPKQEVKVDMANLPEDYDDMTLTQIRQRYKIDTGLDWDKISKGSITKRKMKTFDTAYTTAKALKRVKDFKKSATAYKIAEELSSGPKDANYEFYLDYSEVALLVKDESLYGDVWAKYIAAIKKDSSIAPEKKKDLVERAEQAEKLRKLGY